MPKATQPPYQNLLIAAAIILIILIIITSLTPSTSKVAAPLTGLLSLAFPPAGKRRLTLCMRAYVPTMTAGAEITSHVTNQHLQKAGWDPVVIVKHWSTPSHEGIPIIQSLSPNQGTYDDTPEGAAALQTATILGFQNIAFEDALAIAKQYKKPAVFFIHSTSAGKEFFNYTGGWPIAVVYNSWTMMGDISAPYPSYIVKPWVDIRKFSFKPTTPKYVTLINLNESKGGRLLADLARRMPDVHFMGVEGGYGEQIRVQGLPNITYMSKTPTPEDIYHKTKILLVPSDKETWGRVAVEGMAAGIPVLINDVPGLRECCGDAAIVCRREDLSAWEDQIRRLLAGPAYYEEWSQRSRRRARQLADPADMLGLAKWLTAFAEKNTLLGV
jgi:glycosyltransferase involved in cell wall biosynthesis